MDTVLHSISFDNIMLFSILTLTCTVYNQFDKNMYKQVDNVQPLHVYTTDLKVISLLMSLTFLILEG